MSNSTKKITAIAMFCTLAYIAVVVGRIPLVLFLKYEPKDVIITIAGFIFGPLSTFTISIVVSFVEMITISNDGIIGFFMNVVSTVAFAGTAAYIYKKKPNRSGAVLGLLTGTVLMTILMLMWNYLVTPIFLGYPREKVVELLLPAILPFNLIKAGINTAIVLLLYKPVMSVLLKADLISKPSELEDGKKVNIGIVVFAAFLLISCFLVVAFI